ncbi:nucleotidyltransferase family protein [Paenibacillus motobuensis]|uniref:Nucleotidyltransferase n=1 Tax=Paenibacillus motobuensis TaxID=295324 RepID=A0ABN0Y4R1_9BACL
MVMSPYQIFILECINFNTYNEESLRNAIDEISDWDYLARIVKHNRLEGIVYSVLMETQLLSKINTDFRDMLSEVFEINKLKNDDLNLILKDIGAAINNSSYKYAFLKGSYLIPKIYKKGQRVSNDIDILISQSGIDQIDVDLKQANFVQKVYRDGIGFVEPTRREKIFARMNYGELVPYFRDYPLKGISTVIVDINISLDFQAKYNTNLVDDMLENSILFEVDNDLKLSTLGREDFLIHLCAHLFKEATIYDWVKENRDTQLYKYCDIYAVLQTVDSTFFENLQKKIFEYGLEKECYFTFVNSRKLFPYICDISELNNLIENIRPDNLTYLNEIYWPLERKVYTHNTEFIDWIFYEDKLSVLKEISNVRS